MSYYNPQSEGPYAYSSTINRRPRLGIACIVFGVAKVVMSFFGIIQSTLVTAQLVDAGAADASMSLLSLLPNVVGIALGGVVIVAGNWLRRGE